MVPGAVSLDLNPYPEPSNTAAPTSGNGYSCRRCGAWVNWGQNHICGQQPDVPIYEYEMKKLLTEVRDLLKEISAKVSRI